MESDYAFNKLRWHIYITPAFCQGINPLSARTKRRKGFTSVNISFGIFLFFLTVTAFFYYNFVVIDQEVAYLNLESPRHFRVPDTPVCLCGDIEND